MYLNFHELKSIYNFHIADIIWHSDISDKHSYDNCMTKKYAICYFSKWFKDGTVQELQNEI